MFNEKRGLKIYMKNYYTRQGIHPVVKYPARLRHV